MHLPGSARSSRVRAGTLPLAALLAVACDTGAKQGPRTYPPAPAAGERPSGGGAEGSRTPVAEARGQTVTWADLTPSLVELAGVTVLRDEFLDQRIAQELSAAGLVVSERDVAAERDHLIASLDADPNTAERLLDEIRQRQGLGPVRFDSLLRRNAGLRKLVAADVRITADALARHHDSLHGPRRVCRIVALQTLQDADQVKRELDAGASIADLAQRRSTDASAARGGLLPPIAKGDPTWPEALREALFSLELNQVSPPTFANGSYLVVRLEEIRAADGVSLDAVRPAVEASLRRAQERVLMEELALRYVRELRPEIYDPLFDQAWRRSAR